MTCKVSVIDYGLGNLLSVMHAFQYCDATMDIVETISGITKANHLVLPGVGAFSNAMEELHSLGIKDAIIEHAKKGKPILGICLGMQLLFDESEEFGRHAGLGLVSGTVKAISAVGEGGIKHKIPHIGWNELLFSNEVQYQPGLLFSIKPNSAAYFVHSYRAVPSDLRDQLAKCDYDGIDICAIVVKENITGCQFHPEKSGETGLMILRNFLAG